MNDVMIGKGNLAGKGVYANRDFKKGEVVIKFNLKPVTLEEFETLPGSERMFTHNHKGQIYLYSEPERYVNHSFNGNVATDFIKQCDIAISDIKKGEAITGDATKDDLSLLRKVDAVVVKVPDIRSGLKFYVEQLGQRIIWIKEDMAGLKLGDSELVLSTKFDPETDILVESVLESVEVIVKAGGSVVVEPEDIPVGKVAVVKDPFGNTLTLVDLSKGLYKTDESGNVTVVKAAKI